MADKNYKFTLYGGMIETDAGDGSSPIYSTTDNIHQSIKNGKLVITDDAREIVRAKVEELPSVAGLTLVDKARTIAANIFRSGISGILTLINDQLILLVGSSRPIGNAKVADMGTTTRSVTAEVPLVAVRIKSGNDSSRVAPTGVSMIGVGGGNVKYSVYLLDAEDESDLSDAVWIDQGDECISEYSVDLSMSFDSSNAIKLSTDYFSNNTDMGNSKFGSNDTISVTSGTSDILVLTAAKFGADAVPIAASLKYDEL